MFFSIIVPAHNVELYLDRCLQSILQQTFTDFEVILINDGSQDKSAEICAKYAQMDRRIKFLQQENQGVSATRNTALGIACAQYIIWVDADDSIEEDLLAEVKKTIDQSSADIVELLKHPYFHAVRGNHEQVLLNHSEGTVSEGFHRALGGGWWYDESLHPTHRKGILTGNTP